MNDFQMSFLATEHRSALLAEADRTRRARGGERNLAATRTAKPARRRSLSRLHIGRVALF